MILLFRPPREEWPLLVNALDPYARTRPLRLLHLLLLHPLLAMQLLYLYLLAFQRHAVLPCPVARP
jgi:hypothetical protein